MQNISSLSKKRFLALGVGVFAFFLAGTGVFATHPLTAHAAGTLAQAAGTTLKLTDFTLEKGWKCDAKNSTIISLGTGEKANCTNTTKDTKSPFFNSSVGCYGNMIGETSFESVCVVTFSDKSTMEVSTNNTPGAGDNGTGNSLTQGFDQNGNSTGSTLTSAPPAPETCGFTLNPLTLGGCILSAVGETILTLANLLLGISGALLNWVVVKTVFQFGSLIGNSPGLLISWGIMRDIGNMLLLFGFIFMGLMTILDLHSFPTRKAIPQLIIFAILMNFSLFAAEAVIDTSNALSSVMYKQTNTDPCGNIGGGILGSAGGTNGAINANCVVDYGIAGHIMQSTGLSSMFQINGSFSTQVVTYIGLALFSTIGAVVMFATSIMLVIRVVVLSFIMIAAPIGFAGMAVPPLRKFANTWWHNLISQSFFAPVLFLLIFVSLKVTDSFAGANTRGSLAAALTSSDASVMGIIMIFVIVIGFLVASLMVAKSMGAAGASFAIEKAGGVVYGTGAWAGRNTGGFASNWANDKIRSSKFGQTRIGRRVATLTEKGAKGTYDFRGSALGGAVAKRTGSLGKPAKDGYIGQVKRESEEYKKYADTLKQTTSAKEEAERLAGVKDVATKEKTRIEGEKDRAQKAWNNHKKEQQEEIARQQSALKYDDDSRKRALDLQSKKVQAAVDANDPKKQAEEQAEFDSMAERYKADREQQASTLQGVQNGLRAAEEAHNQNVDSFNTRIANADAAIKQVDATLKGDKGQAGFDADSSKRAFAMGIRDSITPPWKGKSRGKAYELIKKDLGKSKIEKDIEALRHSIDDGNAEAAQRLDTVAAGAAGNTGGTPAPAPAGGGGH
jgi:hypothetical protein